MPQGENTAVIKFDGKTHRNIIRGAVNGQRYEFPVDTDVTVTGEQLQSLRESNVSFDIVSPLAGEDADEGSSASSTEKGTAIRAEPPPQAVNPALDVGVPELSQRTDAEIANGQKIAEEESKANAAKAEEGKAPAEDKGKTTTEKGTAIPAETPAPTPATAAATTTKPRAARSGTKPKAVGKPKAANK